MTCEEMSAEIDDAKARARKLEALLRTDFRAFVHKAFATLCPGQEYISCWHVEAIAYRLEQVRRGEIRRLIINMPPRSLKSIMASVAFPAFVLGRDPSRRIICISYSGDLAKKHSNDFRAVLESPWYRSDVSDDAGRALQELGNRDRAHRPRVPACDFGRRNAYRSRRRHHHHR